MRRAVSGPLFELRPERVGPLQSGLKNACNMAPKFTCNIYLHTALRTDVKRTAAERSEERLQHGSEIHNCDRCRAV